MPKFRYSLDSGTSWVVVDAALPYNIPATASQDVIVEPIGAAVSNLGTVSGNFLSLTYDASNPSANVAAFTNTSGTFYWAITSSQTPPSAAAIIAGTGFTFAGNVGTVPGSLAITLPSMSGAPDLYMHAVVNGAQQTNIASVRVYIGTASSWIAISGTTGAPTITNYTDGDGTWRAYEWTGAGSFTVSTGGGLEYELVAGGGGGGGGVGFVRHGGGGAGGVLRGTTTLTPGTYSIVVGAGGAGGSSATPRSASGGNSTALGLTAVGGGAGASGTNGSNPALTGGSGGGQGGITSAATAGTAGQGFAGGGGASNGGGGGGGAGGAGANGADNIGGAGGAGITSTITGTSRGIAGGGGASGSTTAGSASHGGGAGVSASNTNGNAATAAGGGGGAANGTGTGGAGFRGHFILRIKTA